ncbi:MAG: protein TolQ [Neomegalonema sp.]|nr:protein TolQ [Neomegalonema sp.]
MEPGKTAEHGLSMIELVLAAHWFVQLVMLSLIAASIWSWAIVIERSSAYRRLRVGIDQFEENFWSGKALDLLYDEIGSDPRNPIERVFAAGMREWMRSVEQNTGLFVGLRDRLDRAMDVALAREIERVQGRLSHLATIGSIAPFVGLLGTVWGIKNSFEGIANEGNATVAAVAPGVAEALIATAFGLFAAIPAVIAYNQLLTTSGRLTARLENFADEFATILSRQLDKRGV